MKLTVQMCTYNRKAMLMKALDALFHQTLPADQYEIVLIDDGSSDGTREAVAALQAPCRLNYSYQTNSGLSKGRNNGIRQATGQYILFIDDDIVAHPRLLEEHVRWHEKHPKTVVRGWVNHTEDVTQETRPRFTMADISTAFFWTSNVSVEVKYLVEAGLFDEDFREYGWEDLELGLRLKKLGLRMRYNKSAIVYHLKTKWIPQDVPKLVRQAESKARTAVIFLRKHPTLRVRMATGIDPLRLLLTDLLNAGGWGARLCQRVLSPVSSGPLRGLPLLAARQLITFTYFDTLKASLRK